MKSVTIPMIGANPLVVTVNGVRNEYKAGATYTVDDGIAGIIENIIANFPKEKEMPGTAGQVWTRTLDGADWADLPEIPVAENVAECEATTVAGCVTSINAIITALVEAGLMEEPAEAEA